MGQGVEWAMHVLLSLVWVDDDRPVSTARLAAGHDLPQAYLTKQLQALVRAGLLESFAGAHGGFRLARAAGDITLMDVVTAIDGPEPAFRCTEIRERAAGAPRGGFRDACAVDASMRRADLAWRTALQAQTLADVKAEAELHAPEIPGVTRGAYGRV